MRSLAEGFHAPRTIVPHSRPCLGEQEERAASRVLMSGRLAPGAQAARLETLLARAAEGAAAVCLSSGTTALTLALRSLGIGPRDEVAVPSYTCAAVLHAVRSAGASPLVCDVDPETLALDHEDLHRRAGGALRAVVLVHPFGLAAPVESFRRRGLLVIEDCAQALGAVDGGRPVGSRGDAAVFSFAPTKVITCGGPGGALTSPRAAVVSAGRDAATHDERDDDGLRLNGLMGDLHAAIAIVQFERLREFRNRRAAIAARYDEAFAALPFVRVAARPDTKPMMYRYLLRVPNSEKLLASLNDRGVMARRPVYAPLHRLLRLRSLFPATERLHSELVSLPLSPALSEAEVDRVIEEVRRCRS